MKKGEKIILNENYNNMSETHYYKEKDSLRNNSLFSFLFSTICLVVTICCLTFSTSHIPLPGISVSKEAIITRPTNLCDKTVPVYRPNFAPPVNSHWNISCIDYLKSDKKNSSVYGITFDGQEKIYISRRVPINLLTYVIDHEWTHATIDYHGYMSQKKLWSEWSKYAKKTVGLQKNALKGAYYNDPNEILADNNARCYLHLTKSVIGFGTIPCDKIYEFFPALKTPEKIITINK